ncbi:hypothetical protein ANAEL_03858 [Anaerolineales bacterium]|nr:hypothetical protein ANAEL_03858 [Anaerolineales bacterium]
MFAVGISGWLQVRYGFDPSFIGTIILYTISVFMCWTSFWRQNERVDSITVTTD